jgi:hypothetical protein
MSEKFEFGDTPRLDERQRELKQFLDRMFDDADRPMFVADDASIYDIYVGDDTESAERCERFYAHKLITSEFRLPLWKLLNVLYHRAS